MNRSPLRRTLTAGIAAVAAAVSLAGAALAQALPVEKTLPLALAQQAAAAAVAACAADGWRVSAAVVGRDGLVRALLRGDGAGPHTLDSSSRKAYTAASLRRPTSEFVALLQKRPEVEGLRDMNERILILGGGLPIVAGDEVVGGIGVGGAPGGDLDDACAQAGIDAISGRLR